MSRLTFRDPVGGKAYQKQLRDRYARQPMPAVPHLDVGRAEIRRVSRKLASQIILQYEWLGTMSMTSNHYGIFFGDYCAGVTCCVYGGGTGGVNSHKMFGIQKHELAILARGACVHWAPTGANSKLVSWTARLMAVDTPCKLMIAYADTDAGEIGTIYQACNWLYIGPGSATRQWIAPNGRVMDQKLPYNIASKYNFERGRRRDYVAALRDAGWKEQLSNPKHRYVTILDKKDTHLRDLVERLRRPYPKRAASIDGDAPPDQGGLEDGSSPIAALHGDDTLLQEVV